MVAVTAPAGVSAQHQKLLHFVANSTWSDPAVPSEVQKTVVPKLERHGQPHASRVWR
jgi:SRSO17 transposase